MPSIGDVVVDGQLVPAGEACVPVFDIGLLRGYGCFEALRSYGGVPFRLGPHLDRLEASAEKLGIGLPDRRLLEEWARDRARRGGDCVVRIVVTGGVSVVNPGTESRTVVFAEPIPHVPFAYRVLPLPAPWHSDRSDWGLTGAKTLSYAPNLAASYAARASGYDDALLLGSDEVVLEGPTYSVGWVRDDAIETPGLNLGILASITRSAVLEIAADLGIAVVEGAFRLGAVLEADEVFCMSTVKEVRPITSVGPVDVPAGSVTRDLAAGFAALVTRESASVT
jgi:branched-chain amino acid aminotransferase